MANAAKLAARKAVRMLIAGYPGTAKTGMLASLANAGYKLRILDFDGNTEPLLNYTKPEFLKNIDIVSCQDKLERNQKFIGTKGEPKAFLKALDMMDEWKYKEEDGTEVNLGKSQDWGCDTIVVLDSNSALGRAIFRRVRFLRNKTPLNTTQQVWGISMEEQENFIEKLTAAENKFHVIVITHLKMIGPKDIVKDDDVLTKELKERAADLTPTRLFPNALGRELPKVFAGHFSTFVLAESKARGNEVKRVIKTQPQPDLDLKVPAEIDKVLEIKDGLAYIFSKLAPPLKDCQAVEVSSASTKKGEAK